MRPAMPVKARAKATDSAAPWDVRLAKRGSDSGAGSARRRDGRQGEFCAWASALTLLSLSDLAAAQTASNRSPPSTALEPLTVVGTTPAAGVGIDIDKLPQSIQVLDARSLTRAGPASVIAALNAELGSVSVNDNLDDPFQPDILFRGFEASPVLGTPEGLAVYQNGVRVNEAFGDGLNWDLFPDIAIHRITVVSSNPVYGLNALGGAVVIDMKNGFSDQGGEAEVSGGSWGQRGGSAEYGVNSGHFGFYVAGRVLNEDGWRQRSADYVRQIYADLSYHAPRLTFDLSVTGANNLLTGESATPVQELAIDRSLIFTSPQGNTNRLAFVTLNGGYQVSPALSVQANVYYRDYYQGVVNGNTTDYAACTSDAYAGYLCQADGATPLRNSSGALLPDISNGGAVPLGENDYERIHTVGLGGSLQATETGALFGHENHLSVGGSIDSATTNFGSSAQIGTINAALVVAYTNLFVDTPEGTPWTATPVSLIASNRYYGVFATDTFDVTDSLAVTASARFNDAHIGLADQRGVALNGQNHYRRINPAIGFTERLSDAVTLYGGYSEGSRAPTPGEIECSDPAAPCLLPSSLSSDPPTLRQVVSHTWEAGLRGHFAAPLAGRVTWNADYFRTDVDDDIYGVATSLSTGYFQNIGGTRREGAEVNLTYRAPGFSLNLSYSYVDATFQSAFLLHSPQNSFADANGDIQVEPGDALPGIPAHRIKAGGDLQLTPPWMVGADIVYASPQYFRGDESNQMKRLAGYAVIDLHSRYQLTDRIELFVNLVNATNNRYATFGVLGDPTGVGAPGIPPDAVTNGPGVDNRFESPAAPISAFGGVRVRF
jgi:iron complex outermembrane receptor protein